MNFATHTCGTYMVGNYTSMAQRAAGISIQGRGKGEGGCEQSFVL